MPLPDGVKISDCPPAPEARTILTHEAIQFVADLHRQFNKRRLELLANRNKVQAELDEVRRLTSTRCVLQS